MELHQLLLEQQARLKRMLFFSKVILVIQVVSIAINLVNLYLILR